MLFRPLPSVGLLLAFRAGLAAATYTAASTILIIARDEAAATQANSGLRGYGIPYETLIVPSEGATLPELQSSDEDGNYGGFIIIGEVGYQYGDVWRSGLTADQWDEMYEYQVNFGARMVRLDVYPGPAFGVKLVLDATGCCETGIDQKMRLTNSTGFGTANLKLNADLSTAGLWHYPAEIVDPSIAWKVAEFAPADIFATPSVAAIINRIGRRQQMVFFIGIATDWSLTSNYFQHAYIHWMTRGLFVGKRKTYLNIQVDDMHLDTELYEPLGATYRIGVGELNSHKTWQSNINTRLPAGSKFFLEMGHNGNGDIIVATDLLALEADLNPTEEETVVQGPCTPMYPVDYPEPSNTPLEYKKRPGTGKNLWPSEFSRFTWNLQCSALDTVAAWFQKASNRDVFAHVSHTFTHLELNNATYSDASKEIFFNQDWLDLIGISEAPMFSPAGLIPPAITGLHNADAIRAWMDNGIRYVVGDNTRPLLRNEDSDYWPKYSTAEDNGYDGLLIIPRWATTIFYNCDTPACTLSEWINTSGGKGNFKDLLDNARATNVRYLLQLHHDPFMFHQANMRQADVEPMTVGNQSGRLSILQAWVETVTQEMTRLTNWPIQSLKHDDIAKLFINRMTLDQCYPSLTYVLSDDQRNIVAVEVRTDNNKCGVEVPVTLPGNSATPSTSTPRATIKTRLDKLGSEPPILWLTMGGSVIKLTLDRPIPIN